MSDTKRSKPLPNGHKSDDPWGRRYGEGRVEAVVRSLNESKLAKDFKWTFKFVPEKNVIEASQLVAAGEASEALLVLELHAQPIIECDKPLERCETCAFTALIDTIISLEEGLLNDPELEEMVLAELGPLTKDEEEDVTGLLNIHADVIRFNDPKTELKLYPPWADNPDILN